MFTELYVAANVCFCIHKHSHKTKTIFNFRIFALAKTPTTILFSHLCKTPGPVF